MQGEQHISLMSQWYLECQRIVHQLNRICEQFDLSYDQYLVLEQIIEMGHDTPTQIASIFQTSAPAASRKINTLQKKFFIEKIRDMNSDQRTVKLNVTDDGLKNYQLVRAALEETDHKFSEADVAFLKQIKVSQ